MLRRVALVRTDVSEERSAFQTSICTKAIGRNIPEDGIFLSHSRENLKPYIEFCSLLLLSVTSILTIYVIL
jgi:hypothetical protein